MTPRRTLDLPKHTNPSTPDRTACAPYNFVPLPEKVILAVERADELPNHDSYADGRFEHTGYFTVDLTTQSPLYVRCALTRDQFDLDELEKDRHGIKVNNDTRYADRIKNTPDFFYTQHREEPVIPGSSLRGMLRNLLEIISYSKMQTVNSRNIFFRAVADRTSLGDQYRSRMQTRISGGYCPQVHAGYVRKVGKDFEIIPAQTSPHGVQYYRVEETTAKSNISDLIDMRSTTYRWMRKDIWFQPAIPRTHRHSSPMYYGDVTALQEGCPPAGQSGWVQGCFVASGWIPSRSIGKHLHWIVNHKGTLPPIKLSEEDVSAYKDGGGITDKIREQDFSVLPNGDEEIPCFYIKWSDARGIEHVALGHTPYFRLPYEGTPLDYVPPELRQPTEIDFAEAIFGYTKKQGVGKQRSYASRISVTDAELVSAPNGLWLQPNPVTPKILASPKPTCFQHYLVQPSDDLKFYSSPTPDATVVRGHKLYWHQGESSLAAIQENSPQWLVNNRVKETSKQHTQFKPVRSSVTFRFRLYFENLSNAELGALCWVLHPLGDPTTKYCHKLGLGKPYGLGAVELNATLHLSNREDRYASLFSGDAWQTSYEDRAEELDRQHVERRAAFFVKKILDDLAPFKDGKTASQLADLKRIGTLLSLMKWPGTPATPPISNVPANSQNRVGNTRYMTIELQGVSPRERNEYKDRPILPDASGFDGISGDVEPEPSPLSSSDPDASRNLQNESLATNTSKANRRVKATTRDSKEVVTIVEVADGRITVRTKDGLTVQAKLLNSGLDVSSDDHCHATVTRQGDKILKVRLVSLVSMRRNRS